MVRSAEAINKAHREKAGRGALAAVGGILCIIFLPILLVNLTLVLRSDAQGADLPSVWGYMPLVARTEDMSPGIKRGDLVICQTAQAQDIVVGDVIAFFDPEDGATVIIQRVISVYVEEGQLYFTTQGDAVGAPDELTVSAEDFVGIYCSRVVGAGKIAIFMQSALGLIMCVALPLLLLVGLDALRRSSYEEQYAESTGELISELEALRAEKAKRPPEIDPWDEP
jgi:signal peptidase